MKTASVPGKMPSVSIIIPTHKQYPLFKQDKLVLKKIIGEAGMRMENAFGKRVATDVVSRLNKMKSEIDFKRLNEGLVLHYSPNEEKIYHLSFKPTEKLILDNTFEIRDILYELKNTDNYLILVITENSLRVIKCKDGIFSEVKSTDFPLGKKDTGGKGTSRTKNFSSNNRIQHASDSKAYDELRLDKYLADIDHIISGHEELRELPFIICAPVRIYGKFKKITVNQERIIGFVKGNMEKKTLKQLVAVTEKILNEGKLKKQREVLSQIKKGGKSNRLVWGIRNVYKSTMENKAHLLVVERDYMPSSLKMKEVGVKERALDLVDNLIEKVLAQGGDVEFVDNGKLSEYEKIALITRY